MRDRSLAWQGYEQLQRDERGRRKRTCNSSSLIHEFRIFAFPISEIVCILCIAIRSWRSSCEMPLRLHVVRRARGSARAAISLFL